MQVSQGNFPSQLASVFVDDKFATVFARFEEPNQLAHLCIWAGTSRSVRSNISLYCIMFMAVVLSIVPEADLLLGWYRG